MQPVKQRAIAVAVHLVAFDQGVAHRCSTAQQKQLCAVAVSVDNTFIVKQTIHS